MRKRRRVCQINKSIELVADALLKLKSDICWMELQEQGRKQFERRTLFQTKITRERRIESETVNERI